MCIYKKLDVLGWTETLKFHKLEVYYVGCNERTTTTDDVQTKATTGPNHAPNIGKIIM